MISQEHTPDWIDRNEYPFQSHFIKSQHGNIHYLDEGQGDILVFVHGNPNWSFGYRELIKHFSKTHRCIAIDHIGFGLSDKPYQASYTPQFHAENLTWFINSLELKDITLLVHDWGGPIAINYAQKHVHNVKRLVVFNSWFWSIKGVRTLENFSRLMGSKLGEYLCKYFNFFPRILLKADVGDVKAFPKTIHQHYINAFADPNSRKGTWIFPRSFLKENNWLLSLWVNRDSIKNIPILLIWGLKDKAFPEPFRQKWQDTFIHSSVANFSSSGHNVPEEIGKRAIQPIAEFLAK